jgi:hypothetical protein
MHAKLETARSKLAEVEHRDHAVTPKNEGLKKDLESARTAHDAATRDKADVEKAKCVKLQQFQDSVCKKLADLLCDTEASVATLGGRSAGFPTITSLSDFFEWFQVKVAAMPTTFAECNENITCYALIGVFQMLTGEGCEHLPELKKLALSSDASVLQDFPAKTGWIAKWLVKNWWTKHGLPYCMQKIEEENRVSSGTLSLVVGLCMSLSNCLFLISPKLMKALEVVTSMKASRLPEMALKQRLLREDTSFVHTRDVSVHGRRLIASTEKAGRWSRCEGKNALLMDVPGTPNVKSKGRRGSSTKREATLILSAAPGAVSPRMRRSFVER